MHLTKLCVLALLTVSKLPIAHADCNQDIDNFFNKYSPSSKEVFISGQYKKKSSTGERKECELSIKKEGRKLIPSWEDGKLDPNNGDGGGIWPFGNYPTIQPTTNSYSRTISFNCSASEDNISIDYFYQDKTGWYRTHRNSLSITHINSNDFEVSFRDGQGKQPIVCIGSLSEKN